MASSLIRRAAVLFAALVLPVQALSAPIEATLYKSAQCTCCEGHARHLAQSGFVVEVRTVDDLASLNRKAAVPEALEGCHALFIGGYVVQGHVPANVINKLLRERPSIIGIAIPGMPLGVPGMEGPRSEPLAVYEIAAGATDHKVFAIVP